MSWLLWIVVAYFAYAIVWGITQVGKPREPYTPGGTAFAVVIMGVLAVLILIGGGLLG